MSTVALRPANPADGEFCFRLHRAAMREYVDAVRGWDDEEQRAYHERAFAPGRWQIVTVDGADAGLLIVEYRAREVYLTRIELHPDHQGRGIGAGLIRFLAGAAARRGQSLVLDVLAVNTRALAFYRRHGFREEARHEEGATKVRMRRPAAPPPGVGGRAAGGGSGGDGSGGGGAPQARGEEGGGGQDDRGVQGEDGVDA
ncbi:N-acetyltransferase family protein [Streptomyces bungoensis]